MRNGSHGTVIAVHAAVDPSDDHIAVDFVDLGAIELPRRFFDEHHRDHGSVDVGLDHDYAITSYAAQGLTFPRSSSQVDAHSTLPEVYVEFTRGVDDNQLFVTAPDDAELSGERLPALSPPPERDRLEQRLTRSGPEITALELDHLAGAAALHAHGTTLAQLTRERLVASGGARKLLRRAERIRAHQIHRPGRAHPDRQLVARLLQRPPEAFLAARYDKLLGDIAVYRTRWEPHQDRGSPLGWALGEPVDHPEATNQRQQLVAESRRAQHPRLRPSASRWSGRSQRQRRQRISTLASAGALGRIGAQRLAEALARETDPAALTDLGHLIAEVSQALRDELSADTT